MGASSFAFFAKGGIRNLTFHFPQQQIGKIRPHHGNRNMDDRNVNALVCPLELILSLIYLRHLSLLY
jgi:hypothetical protein